MTSGKGTCTPKNQIFLKLDGRNPSKSLNFYWSAVNSERTKIKSCQVSNFKKLGGVGTIATIAFRLILTRFRPNSDQTNTEIKTNFDS